MTWISELQEFAHTRGRRIWNAPEGIGIDFADGYDVCWFIPQEVTSTIPIQTSQVDSTPLIQEFLRLEDRRRHVLIILRQYFVDMQIATNRLKSGDWGVQLKGGAITSVSVGAYLTKLLRVHIHLRDVLDEFFKGSFLRRPYPKRLERYLDLKEAAPDLDWRDDTTIEVKSTLAMVLAWMGVCKVVKSIGESDSEELSSLMGGLKLLKRGGRIVEMLKAMNELIPDVKASADLSSGHIHLEFSDELDSFEIAHKSRGVIDLVKQFGPQGAAKQLVTQYHHINRQRQQVLKASKRAAFLLGLNWEDAHEQWFFGTTQCLVSLPIKKELTQALLKGETPEQILRQLSTVSSEFAEACVQQLEQEGDISSLVSTPMQPYIVKPPKLVNLTAEVVARMDDYHRQSLREHLASDQGLHSYIDRLRYDPDTDTWASAADWKQAAEACLSNEYVSQEALIVLLNQGDEGVRQKLETHLHEWMLHDVTQSAVELAWRFRNQKPELGAVWFQANGENVPCADYRVELNDPIAIRQLVVTEEFDELDIREWPLRITRAIADAWIPPPQREKYRSALLHWARTNFQWEMVRDAPFAAAWALNLPEVMDALDENRFLTEALLCYNENRNFTHEPAIYLAANMLLYWSKLKPTRLLAQIIASTDPELFRKENRGGSTYLRTMGVDYHAILDNWYQSLKVPLAIAWHRCRKASVCS